MSKSIHFIGIGGIGMSALALFCHDRGWKASGSNLGETEMTHILASKGMKVFSFHDARHISADLNAVVISSAIAEDNPELKEARRLGLHVMHRSDFLDQCVREHKVIGVSGTHGKTTTTSLLGHIFHYGHQDPLIFAGGIMNSIESPLYPGRGSWAIVEADESDKSHINFAHLAYAVITNIEADHLVNYDGCLSNLLESFAQMVRLAQCCLLCGDDPGVQQMMREHSFPDETVITYGTSNHCMIRASNIHTTDSGMYFDVEGLGAGWHGVNLALWGQHNVLNALAVIGIAEKAGLKTDIIKQGLACFPGVDRRLTKRGHYASTLIMDDYAHHPTEIQATILALQQQGWKRILVVCQPHRYTRLKETWHLFDHCFSGAQHVVLLPVYGAGEVAIEPYDSWSLAHRLRSYDYAIEAYQAWPDSRLALEHLLENGGYDVAVFMGAGSISNIAISIALAGEQVDKASHIPHSRFA